MTQWKRKRNRTQIMPDPFGRKAGIISKPYGLGGRVNLIREPGVGIQITEGIPLFVSMDGQRVPFFITGVEHVAQNHLILKFEFIDNLDEARKLSGCEVFLDPASDSDSANDHFSFEQITGYQVIDTKTGPVGTISGYMPQAHNPVFIIERGQSELMIPASDQLIDRIDHSTRTIYYRLPEGLIDV